ncbi:DUF2889 domain-containing protein [Desulfosporosinus meridiei]|uniref:DUF2889 domain-containing protein n=1 Tax=Desulfosporosinus meridiei (strain ATCC BAA-275 / DSM 13257 / KCTC 12902 / NCIMB 13706 / S10) TaxID=768704 RepID=J7J692_DESMD|nr:DUF2889 domain-containing protein [Desulfosporosinus meridiei]AFQ46441.1 Protein of unknown function (DUF2889) [Desulfosporosinus meridiei DSM 13257]
MKRYSPSAFLLKEKRYNVDRNYQKNEEMEELHLFNRSISISVRSKDKDTLTVDGTFIDTHHELCLTLEIEIKTRTITTAMGEFRRAPHTDCAETQKRIPKLVGINLNKNVRRQVQAAVGLKEGCTHITDLTLECVKSLMQASYQLMHLTMREEQITEIVENYLEGSCFHYNKGAV